MERLDYHRIAPAAVAVTLDVQSYVDGCSLEKKLLETKQAARIADQRVCLLR